MERHNIVYLYPHVQFSLSSVKNDLRKTSSVVVNDRENIGACEYINKYCFPTKPERLDCSYVPEGCYFRNDISLEIMCTYFDSMDTQYA